MRVTVSHTSSDAWMTWYHGLVEADGEELLDCSRFKSNSTWNAAQKENGAKLLSAWQTALLCGADMRLFLGLVIQDKVTESESYFHLKNHVKFSNFFRLHCAQITGSSTCASEIGIQLLDWLKVQVGYTVPK
jgi:hypothetical protein